MEEKFIEVIKEYIDLIDNYENKKVASFLFQCSVLLPQMQYLGQLLPFPDGWDEEDDEDDDDYHEETEEEKKVYDERLQRHHERWSKLHQNLTKYLGKHNSYNVVFNPYTEKESMYQTLADDFADIYLEVYEPLEYYDKDRNKSLWNWKFGAYSHCGNHIVSALRPIHQFIEDNHEEFGW